MFYGYGILNNHVPTLKATTMGGVVVWDTDALAFISAASITDATQKSAINTLVTDFKGYGIWSKMKAIYPMVGGTASQHRLNLKNPQASTNYYYLTFVNGWTHSYTGAKPSGTDAYSDTFLNASTALTNNNYHLSHYSRTQQTNTNAIDIAAEGTTPTLIAVDQYYAGASGKASVLGDYNTNLIIVNNTNTQGLLIGTRTTSTNAKMYFNGSQIGSTLTTTNSNSLPNNTFYLGANHGLLGNAKEFSAKEIAFASIGDGLTDTESSNLYLAVQKFNTTLLRQV
jgi:hypothetical protein